MLSLYRKTIGEDQNCHCYLYELFSVINFHSVSFIMKIAHLGNICKHSQGEACLSKRGKYQYSALGKAIGILKSLHYR